MAFSENFTVRELEQALFSHFPRETAEEWDRCGILVGDPDAEVAQVALALDATSKAVRAAHASGCNVLLTHHPAFLDAPVLFGPTALGVHDAGTAVFEACRLGVALVNYHTCLDRARAGQLRLPDILGFNYLHPLEGASRMGVAPADGTPAYGAVCELPYACCLRNIAERCDMLLGGSCRFWGDPLQSIKRVATCTGSLGDLGEDALTLGLDAVIAGEVRYHTAVDLRARGLAVIELGHDVSEQPLVTCLRDALVAEGLDAKRIVELDLACNWLAVRED